MAEKPRLRDAEIRNLFRHAGEFCRENERLKAEADLLRTKLEVATTELLRARAHATAILRLRG